LGEHRDVFLSPAMVIPLNPKRGTSHAKTVQMSVSAFSVKSILGAPKDPGGISAYCRREGLSDAWICKWQSRMIENANSTFNVHAKVVQAKIVRLVKVIRIKGLIIAALTKETLGLKRPCSMKRCKPRLWT
jgi:hypothetical protein